MTVELSKEVRDALVPSIRRYVQEELEQDIGDLQARLLLDYVLIEVGPVVYNRAVRDAQAYILERALDLEGVCYEEEMTWWTSRGGGRASDPSP